VSITVRIVSIRQRSSSRGCLGYHENRQDTYVYVLDGERAVYPTYRSAASSLVKASPL